MDKLRSQGTASREKGHVRPHTSPSPQAHLVPCPEKAGMSLSSLGHPSKSWLELAFRTLGQKLQGLVPFAKVEEKPQVRESEDLSSGSALSF